MDLATIRQAKEKAARVMTKCVQDEVERFQKATGIGSECIQIEVILDNEVMSAQSLVQRVEMSITI